MNQILFGVVCSSAIGYLFGVVFAVRAILMSELTHAWRDMVVLTGWVGLTFAVIFGVLGLVGVGAIMAVNRRHGWSRRVRIYLLAWAVLSSAIAVPFLGYYYSSGVDPHDVSGATNAWHLVPVWIVTVGRWLGFAALAGSVLAFGAAEGMIRYFSGDSRRRLLRLGIGAPAIVLAMWLLTPTYLLVARGEWSLLEPDGSPVPLEDVRRPLAPVVVVGWDGATWDVIDPLLADGRLPNLQRLMARGVHAELESFEPTSSPLIWTTISTGRPPGQHGVRSQVENRFAGMTRWFFFPPSMGFDHIFGRVWEEVGAIERVQVTSHARRVKAFWNLLDEAGRSVGLVNWRVAWPAEEFRGFNVTDHVHPGLSLLADANGMIAPDSTDAAVYRALPNAIEPAKSRALLQESYLAARSLTDSLCAITGLPRRLAPEHEVFAFELGSRLQREEPADLYALYLYELDGIEHRYWKYREPQYFFDVEAENVGDLGDAIDQIHEFYDHLLGRLLDETPEDAIVILLSDHGHGPVFGEFRRSGGHTHAPPGIVVMAGPGIDRDATLAHPTVYDIFPTLMYLSGLPVERESRGRVLLEAFDDPVIRDRPVDYIDRYAPRERIQIEAPRTSPGDRQRMEILRSLGYVG